MITRKSITPWMVWIIPMTFCIFQFVLRLFPGHVQTKLMSDFNVGAGAFGTFSAAYYLGYASFQIPVAILLEKYKPKVVIAISAFACALGCFILASTSSWKLAIFSRFIIGAGSVTGFLGTTKIILVWFPWKHHAKMIGISMSIGLVGAIYGGKPVSLLIAQFNWQNVLLFFGLIVFGIGVLASFMVKTPKQDATIVIEKNFSWLTQISSLFNNKMFIGLAIANFLMVGYLEGFADIWGINYLSLAVNITKVDASLLTSLIFFGMLLGMPILSIIAEQTNIQVKIVAFCGILMTVLLSILLLNPKMFSIFNLKALMILLGVLSGYQALVFVICERLVPKVISNTAIASLNCINMLGGAFFHKLIGLFVELAATQQLSHGCYSLKEYTIGLAVIPVMSFIGGGLLLVSNSFIGYLWEEPS